MQVPGIRVCKCKSRSIFFSYAEYLGDVYQLLKISRNNEFRTIEGDLFSAFVAAGAISKANASDPKKSALTRCARTDKGVHAAGNVVSLKMIVDEPDILERINSHLSSQIRVWGIQRTTGSFSCYQACDSRWYEYLIPTFAFIPPHPNSYLGQQLEKLAKEANDEEGYRSRQEEVLHYWRDAEREYITPIVEKLEGETKGLILEALYGPSKEFGVSESIGKVNSVELPTGSGGVEDLITDAEDLEAKDTTVRSN